MTAEQNGRLLDFGKTTLAVDQITDILEQLCPDDSSLLNFVKEVTDRGRFLSQAVDIFPDPDGNYLVNELQAFWGSKNPHQMMIKGRPGRYLFQKGQWVFQEGEYNTNNSYDLRLSHVIEILKGSKK